MKKLTSMIFVLAFVLAAFSALAPMVAAKSKTISESEAEKLVFKAYDAYNLLSTYAERYDQYLYELNDKNFLYLTVKDDNGKEYYYYEVRGELLPGGSYMGFFEYAATVFNAAVYEKFTTQSYADNTRQLFMAKDGVIYVTPAYAESNHDFNYFIYDKGDNTVIVTEGDGTHARGVVLCDIITFVPITDRKWSIQIDYSEVECSFEKTPTGWRISECEFASMLMSPGKIEHTVYAGDAVGLRYFEHRLNDIFQFYRTVHVNMPYDEKVYITPFGEDFFADPWGEFSRYCLVKEDELPGGSYEGLVEESRKYFTDAAAQVFLNDYASEENVPLFYVQDGKRYAFYESKNDWQASDWITFLNRGEYCARPTIDSLVINGNRATGTLICHGTFEDHPREWGYTLYAFDVAFVKTEYGWVLDDCEYLRAKTARTTLNADYNKYLVEDKAIYEKYGVGIPSNIDLDSPATGDNAFDTLAISLGGMAVAVSLLCIIRRRREE